MMKKQSKKHQIMLVLASSSPRRAALLKSLEIDFSIRKSQIAEKPRKGESPEKYATRVAEEKASKVGVDLAEGLVLGCDTIVTLNNEIFGKPASPQSAAIMLSALSGRWHNVISGLALYNAQNGRMVSGSSITAVKFFPLDEEDIAWYIDSREPMDKAGGYGIQGLGMIFIEKIEGSYTNVVGLPIELMRNLLKKMGIELMSLFRRPF
jgi:septum formation protein